MTPDDALARSRNLIALNVNAFVDPEALSMARFIVDTLGVGFPCGWPEPTTGAPAHTVQVGSSTINSGPMFVEWNGATMDRDEALGIAAALIRCAAQLPEQE